MFFLLALRKWRLSGSLNVLWALGTVPTEHVGSLSTCHHGSHALAVCPRAPTPDAGRVTGPGCELVSPTASGWISAALHSPTFSKISGKYVLICTVRFTKAALCDRGTEFTQKKMSFALLHLMHVSPLLEWRKETQKSKVSAGVGLAIFSWVKIMRACVLRSC